jgi:hypothetical protein
MENDHNSSENNLTDQTVSTSASVRDVIEYEQTLEILQHMIKDPNSLKEGYKIFQKYETMRNFYTNLLKTIFNPQTDQKMRKLAASALKLFLRKNWSDDNYITNEERMVLYKLI